MSDLKFDAEQALSDAIARTWVNAFGETLSTAEMAVRTKDAVLSALNLTPAQAALLLEGKGVVAPREPTPEMFQAGKAHCLEVLATGTAASPLTVWRLMLTASEEQTK